MQPHILTIPDDAVYEQLLQLATAAGLHIATDGLVSKSRPAAATQPIHPNLTEAEWKQHLEIIRRGGSGRSIPDPLAWQRETRADRPLPGRD